METNLETLVHKDDVQRVASIIERNELPIVLRPYEDNGYQVYRSFATVELCEKDRICFRGLLTGILISKP